MKVSKHLGASPPAADLGSAAGVKKTIGTGLKALDLDALKAAASKLGLLEKKPASSQGDKNTLAFPDLSLRFEAPDEKSRAFAESAIAASIAATIDSATRRADDKHPVPTREAVLQGLFDKYAVPHLKIVFGVDENLKGKSEAEVAERQRLSSAILAELGRRVWAEIPFEKILRDNPRAAAAMLQPATQEASAALDARVELALMAQELRSRLALVPRAAELGLKLTPADQKLLAQADREADVTPQKSWELVAELVKSAAKLLESPPPKKMSKDELAELKKAQKAPPPPSYDEMIAKAQLRIAELEGEIVGAPKTPSELERFKGAMVGLAIGDALGGPTEFMSRESLRKQHGLVTDMIGGGWLKLQPGEYTDDTQMAERMAQAIVHKKGFDLEEIGKEFVGWLDTDPKDVGGLTRQALELKRIGVPAEQAGQIPWVLSGYENAGNGSVMRAAPIGLLTAFKPVDEIDATARASSAITHADPRATYGTAAINLATSMIIAGETDVVGKVAAWLEDKSPILSEAISAVKDMTAEELRTSGYSVHTVQAAFWALHHAKSYVDGVITVSNLGEDTDTAGATAGILLGAKFGLEGIPQSWRGQLQNREGLEELAEQIHALAKPAKGS